MNSATALLAAALAMAAGRVDANPATPDLGWLAGHWCSEEGGRRIDEVWLSAASGALHGVSRTVATGKVESFEYMRIENGAAGTSFLAQPNGAPPTAFALIEHGPHRVSFTNPANDFPTRIDYRAKGDALHAQISGPGPDGGQMEIPFDYRRCDSAATADTR